MSADDSSDGRGCMLIIGAIIIAVCIGNLYDSLYGWLAFGCALVAFAVLGRR